MVHDYWEKGVDSFSRTVRDNMHFTQGTQGLWPPNWGTMGPAIQSHLFLWKMENAVIWLSPFASGNFSKGAHHNKGVVLKWRLPCNDSNCLPLFWDIDTLSTKFNRLSFWRQGLSSFLPHLAGDQCKDQGKFNSTTECKSLPVLITIYQFLFCNICLGTSEDAYILKSHF